MQSKAFDRLVSLCTKCTNIANTSISQLELSHGAVRRNFYKTFLKILIQRTIARDNISGKQTKPDNFAILFYSPLAPNCYLKTLNIGFKHKRIY